MFFAENLKKDFSLKDLTTFKIGGKTKYFFEAKSQDQIIEAVKWAQQKKLPFFVLAGGSNVLISDKKYKGLVIKIKTESLEIKDNIIEADAGVSLGKLVGFALQNNLTGMEWAIGIPGTLGGAVYGNTGSFKMSISDNLEEVKALEVKTGEIKIFKKAECNFDYRNSIFKQQKNLIILSAKIKLSTGNKIEIENKMKDFFNQKKKVQPLEYYSAGSVFKNSENFSAWELIEKSGLKGKQIGKVQISNQHSNFIVNMGLGKANDVKKLINLIKKQVKKKFNIVLEEEIQFFNF